MSSNGQVVLLTGAGFTKNFGGFLAEEMWAKVFNDPRIQAHPRLATLMRGNFDFESIYADVTAGKLREFSGAEVSALSSVVVDAYASLDDAILPYLDKATQESMHNPRDGFMTVLKRHRELLFFTLNQDLYVERSFSKASAPFVLPGVPVDRTLVAHPARRINGCTALPTGAGLDSAVAEDLRQNHNVRYIKLHGSYGWLARGSDTSKRVMILGQTKHEDIDREPLLRAYFEVFQQKIQESNPDYSRELTGR